METQFTFTFFYKIFFLLFPEVFFSAQKNHVVVEKHTKPPLSLFFPVLKTGFAHYWPHFPPHFEKSKF